MATAAANPAPTLRLRARGRRVPVLAAGLALVLGAVATIGALYLGAAGGKQYWAAATDLPAGVVLTPNDLVLIHASLSESQSAYITDQTNLDGQLLTSAVAAGQLLPANSVTGEAQAGMSNLVVQPTIAFSNRIRVGSIVEVWTATPTVSGLSTEPVRLLPAAEVYRVLANDSAIRAAAPGVELRVADSEVAGLLQAIADGSQLMLVSTADQGGQ